MELLVRGAAPCAGYPKVRLLLDMRTLSDKPLAGDGVFATSQGGNISLVDLKSNTTTTLVKLTDVRNVSSDFCHAVLFSTLSGRMTVFLSPGRAGSCPRT